jgi:transposase-like protein
MARGRVKSLVVLPRRQSRLLAALRKRVPKSVLVGESADHLGYELHDPAGRGSGNSRSGTRGKTVLTDVGPVEIEMPVTGTDRSSPGS